MAKIKCEIKEDSTLVKFEAIEDGEIFVRDDTPFIKLHRGNLNNAFCLTECEWLYFFDSTLVTYVKSAELKLTI